MSQPELMSASPLSVAEPANPFKGLAYYERTDAGRFAGRQRDIEAVVNGILRTRTFVVYGRSGLGKTSLLLAGVLPRLAEQGCLAFDVRLLEDPLGDLRRALSHQCGLGTDSDETVSMSELIERASRSPDSKDRLVIIAFDQFEEFFIRFADQPDPAGGVRSGEELDRDVRQQRIGQREAFIHEMGKLAADARLNVRLVFSIREDWIAEMADFADAIPEITHYMYRLSPLTSFGVRQAIIETLRSVGSEVDSRLVTALIDTLTDVHFDPVVLQVLSSEVWEQAREHSREGEPVRLELRHLEAVGGVRQVFRAYLDQVNSEIDPTDLRRKILTGAVLEALISEKRTKLAVSRESLLQQSFVIAAGELDEVLNRLCRHRLVRSDPRGGTPWFELVHERLVGAILEWFEGDLNFFKFRSARNLLLNSCRNPGWRQNPELLLNQGQLDDTIGPFKDILNFNTEEREFLVSSAVYAHSRDLAYWVGLAGDDTSADLIDRFLDQKESDRLRLRATEAAGRIAERTEHFAGRCLDLALHDSSPQIRQAAARSFAELASAREFQLLAEQLRDQESRGPAIDVLTEVADKDRIPGEIKLGRRYLWKAHRRLYRRRLEAARPAIRERGQRGALVGIAAAFVWSLTAGVLLVRLLLYELLPDVALSHFWSWPLGVAAYLLGALPLGGWAGWHAARSAAKAALRRGREGLSFWTVFGRTTPFIYGAPLLAWLVISGESLAKTTVTAESALTKSSPLTVLGCMGAVLLGLSLWLALLLTAAMPLRQPLERRKRSWFWAWTWAFGGSLSSLPLLFPITYYLKLFGEGQSLTALFITETLIFASLSIAASAALGGIVAYSFILSAIYSSPRNSSTQHIGTLGLLPIEFTPRIWNLHRAFGVALTLIAATFLIYIFGWDGLPFLAHRVVLGESDISRFVKADYPFGTFNIQVTAPKRHGQLLPRIAQVSFPGAWKVYLEVPEPMEPGQSIILQPGESRHIAIEARNVPGTVSLRPDRTLSGSLPFKDPQFVISQFSEKHGNWLDQTHGLDGLRNAKGPFYISLGDVAQGGAWCSNTAITAYISGKSVNDENYIDLPCVSTPRAVAFENEVLWSPRTPAPEIHLQTWQQTSIPHGSAADSISIRGGHKLSYIATFDDGRSDPEATDLISPKEAATSTRDKLSVYIWPMDGFGKRKISFKHPQPVVQASVSRDERWLVTVSGDKKIRIWNVQSPSKPVAVLKSPDDVQNVYFGPDLSNVFAETSTSTLVFDFKNLRRQPLELKNNESIWSRDISRDGSKLATGDPKGNLRVWDLKSPGMPTIFRNPLCTPKAYSEPVKDKNYSGSAILDLDFNTAGDRVVTASQEGNACIWKINEGNTTEPTVLPHNGAVLRATFAKDGSRVLTASADGFARIWTIASPHNPILLRHQQKVNDATFSSDGTRIVTASDDGTVRSWKIDGSPELVIPTNKGKMLAVALTGDNQRIIGVPEFGPVQAWDISPSLRPKELGDIFLFLRVSSTPMQKRANLIGIR